MYGFRQLILDRYLVLKTFTQGAMSKGVYYCKDTLIVEGNTYSQSKKREVIIKVLDISKDNERGIERIKQEAQTQLKLRHKNLVKIYEVIEKDGYMYIVMEYVPNVGGTSTLGDKIKARGVLSKAESLFIFRQILAGMKALEDGPDIRIIHLDLKPDNILITHDGTEIKITDFGISAILGHDNNVASKEKQNRGSAGYVSPLFMYDDKEGEVPLCPQYDYFALGIILFEMLTGELPYKASAKSENDVVECIKKANKYYPPLLKKYDPDLSNILYNIIFKCVVTRSEDRKYWYKNIDEIIKDVELAMQDNVPEVPLIINQIKNSPFEEKKYYSIEREKANQKIFTQPWFAALLTIGSVSILSIVITIVLVL